MTFMLSTIETAAINVNLTTYSPRFGPDVPIHLKEIQDVPGTTYVRIEDIKLKTMLPSTLNTRYRLKISHPEVPNYEQGIFRYKRSNTIDFSGLSDGVKNIKSNLVPIEDVISKEISSEIKFWPKDLVIKNTTGNMPTYIGGSGNNNHSYIYLEDPVKLDFIWQHDFRKVIYDENIKEGILNTNSNFIFKIEGQVSGVVFIPIVNINVDKVTFYSTVNQGEKIILNNETFIIQSASDLSNGNNYFVYPKAFKPQYKIKVEYKKDISSPLAYFNSSFNQKGLIADESSQILVHGSKLDVDASLSTMPLGNYNILVHLPGIKEPSTYEEMFMSQDVTFTSSDYVFNSNGGLVSPTGNLKIKVFIDYDETENIKLYTGLDLGTGVTNADDFKFGISISEPGLTVGNLPNDNNNGLNTYRFKLGGLLNNVDLSGLGLLIDQNTEFTKDIVPTVIQPISGGPNQGNPDKTFGSILGVNLDDSLEKHKYNAYLVLPGRVDQNDKAPGEFGNNIVVKTSGTSNNLSIINIPINGYIYTNIPGDGSNKLFHKEGKQAYLIKTANEEYYSTEREGAFEIEENEFRSIQEYLTSINSNINYNNFDIFNFYSVDFGVEIEFGVPLNMKEPVLIGEFRNKANSFNANFRFLLEYFNGQKWIKVTDADSADPSGEQNILVTDGSNTTTFPVKVITSEVLALTRPRAFVSPLFFTLGENNINTKFTLSNIEYQVENISNETDGNLIKLVEEVNNELSQSDDINNQIIFAQPEQNLTNVVHYVMDRNNGSNFERTYNMLIDYWEIKPGMTISITNPILIYKSGLNQPKVIFSGTEFSSTENNIQEATGDYLTFFNAVKISYETFNPDPDQTIDLVLALPRTESSAEIYLPVSNSLVKVIIKQITGQGNEFFKLYHRTSTSNISDDPETPGTDYGSADMIMFIDFEEYRKKQQSKRFLFSEDDTLSRNFGDAILYLEVSSDIYVVSGNYDYVDLPKVEMINTRIIYSPNTNGIYNKSTTPKKTIANLNLNNTQIYGTSQFLRSMVDTTIAPDSIFDSNSVELIINLQGSGTNGNFIFPKFLLAKEEFSERDINNGILKSGSPDLNYYLNGAIRQGKATTASQDSDFVNIDLYYFVQSSTNNITTHEISDGATFVDDIVQLNIPTGKFDALEYFTTGRNDPNPNRNGIITAKIFNGTEIISYTTLYWYGVSIRRVGIRGKNNQLIVTNFEGKRNNMFKFGYFGEKLSECEVSLFYRGEKPPQVVLRFRAMGSLRNYQFEFIELSQESQNSSNEIVTIRRIR